MATTTRIVCLEAHLSNGDLDTWHVRMTEEQIASYPRYDPDGKVTDRLNAIWTDEEYVARWGKPFVDSPGPP